MLYTSGSQTIQNIIAGSLLLHVFSTHTPMEKELLQHDHGRMKGANKYMSNRQGLMDSCCPQTCSNNKQTSQEQPRLYISNYVKQIGMNRIRMTV